MGRGDTQRRFGDKKPEPNGCAGCPMAIICGQLATKRLNAFFEISEALRAWEHDSIHLDSTERFTIGLWSDLVAAMNRHKWSDPNEDRLADE